MNRDEAQRKIDNLYRRMVDARERSVDWRGHTTKESLSSAFDTLCDVADSMYRLLKQMERGL